MLLRDSKSMSFFAYPAIVAVTLFLLRNRQITEGGSPGSGVTIAGAELLMRISAIVHAAAFASAQGLSLLLRIASAPLILAGTTLQAEFRLAFGAIDGASAFLQHAALSVMHVL